MLLAVHNIVEALPWYATGVDAGYVIAGLFTALGLAFAAAAWRYVRTRPASAAGGRDLAGDPRR